MRMSVSYRARQDIIIAAVTEAQAGMKEARIQWSLHLYQPVVKYLVHHISWQALECDPQFPYQLKDNGSCQKSTTFEYIGATKSRKPTI